MGCVDVTKWVALRKRSPPLPNYIVRRGRVKTQIREPFTQTAPAGTKHQKALFGPGLFFPAVAHGFERIVDTTKCF